MHFPRGCFSSTIDRSSELVHKKATPRRRELRSFGWRLEWSLYLHILFIIIIILILIFILIIYIYAFTHLFIYLFIYFCKHITSIHTFNFTQIMHMHGILYIHTEMAICCIYYIALFNHGCVPAFEREIYGIELPTWVKSRFTGSGLEFYWDWVYNMKSKMLMATASRCGLHIYYCVFYVYHRWHISCYKLPILR